MKRKRNATLMKEQGGNSQDQINEEELSNLPEREFSADEPAGITQLRWQLSCR